MTSMSTAEFEARAADAERRLAAIELHLEAKQSCGSNTASSSDADAAFKRKVLRDMIDVRITLGASRAKAAAVERERDEAVAAVETLRAENEKLKYRVLHLVRHAKA